MSDENNIVHIVDFITGEYYSKAGAECDWTTNVFLAGEFERSDASNLVRILRDDNRVPIVCEV